MPTILTHAALPLLAGWAMGPRRPPLRLVVAGMLASILPDADVIGFRFGIAYGSPFGHRGFSHSLAIAALVALAAALGSRRIGFRPVTTFAFVAAAAASHGLLDMITNGGRGVALLWPFTAARLFAPVRPVEVSPIGLRSLFDPRMLDVFVSELVWIGLPALLLALLWRWVERSRRSTNIDLSAGQP